MFVIGGSCIAILLILMILIIKSIFFEGVKLIESITQDDDNQKVMVD